MKIIFFKDLNVVSTSHDKDLLKYVLSASNQFPPGKLLGLQQISLAGPNQLSPKPNCFTIIVISKGHLIIEDNQLQKYDMIIFSPNEPIPSFDSVDVLAYLFFWQIE